MIRYTRYIFWSFNIILTDQSNLLLTMCEQPNMQTSDCVLWVLLGKKNTIYILKVSRYFKLLNKISKLENSKLT